MADLKGTNVAGIVVPFTTEDTFATHDAKYGKGGWREVADITERDAITDDRLTIGMAVYVLSENKLYIYKGKEEETEAKVWEEFTSGITGVAWGDITGSLSDQSDLNEELTGIGDRIDGVEESVGNIEDELDGYGDIVTHNAAEFQPAGDYATTSELNDLADIVDGKQDALAQGTGITISDNTISANTATNTSAGIAKLYTSTGTNTDGSMDQNSITAALAELNEVQVSTTEPTAPSVEVWINPDGEGFDISTKQDKLIPGYGISISKNEITLPAGYTLLEYVESNGTQFVDTGVIYNAGDNMKAVYQVREYKPYTGDQYLFGAFTDGIVLPTTPPNSKFAYRLGYSNNFDFSGCVSTFSAYNVNDYDVHTIEIREEKKPFVDGNQIWYGFPVEFVNDYGPLPTAGTVVLFGCHSNSLSDPEITDVVSDMTYRIYEFEIEGKCKFIPAKNPDGVVGFYDTVRNIFVTTDRGDDLTAGRELLDNVISSTNVGGGNSMSGVEVTDGYILPEDYQAVEYIQNTGTEMIVVPADFTLRASSFTLEFDFRDVGFSTGAGALVGGYKDGAYYYVERSTSTSKFHLTEYGNGGSSVGFSGDYIDYAHGGHPVFDSLPKRRIDFNDDIQGSWDMVTVLSNRYTGFNTATNIGKMGLFGRITQFASSASRATYRIYRYIQRDVYGNFEAFMIPVKRTLDDAVGMYDFVSKQFCTSVTTPNNFIAGPDKDYHNGISAGLNVLFDKNFTTTLHKSGQLDVKIDARNGNLLSKFETNTGVEGTIYEVHSSAGTGGTSHQKSYQTVFGSGAEGGNEGSTAYGAGAKAISYFSTAIGRLSSASNSYAIAIGTSTNVNAGEAVGVGHNASATGASGVAVGANTKASAVYSTSIGPGSEATGTYTTAIGYQSKAMSGGAVAIGKTAIVGSNGANSIQLGTGTNNTTGKLQVWNWELLDKTTGKIPAERIDAGASALSDLTDVSLSSLVNGQSLVYNNGVWSNAKAGVEVTYDTTHKRLKFA